MHFGIVLAAGSSSRMNQPKALLRLDGVTLVEHACRTIEAAGAIPLVVVGARGEYISKAVVDRRQVENPRWNDGMGTSIAAGVEAVADESKAICILPVDQPGIGSEHLRKLLQTAEDQGLAATRQSDGSPGAPAAFGPAYYDELRRFDGRRGARKILAREDAPAFEAELPQDVDTPEAWRAFLRRYYRSASRMPSYPVENGELEAASRMITCEPGGVLIVEDSGALTDLDTFRELADEDTEPIADDEDARLTEIARAADGLRKRFELFIRDGVEFSRAEFFAHFVENRFVRPFAQGVVWQARAEEWQSVYLSDDCTVLTIDDEPLEYVNRFRVAHPLELNRDSWSARFAEMELVNSIDQLERKTYAWRQPEELHEVDPLPFHRIALELGFEASEIKPTTDTSALEIELRGITILLTVFPGYPFHFPDDDEQTIGLRVLGEDALFESEIESEIVGSEVLRLWLELRRRLDQAGGYFSYG